MIFPVFLLDEVLALLTLRCLRSTSFNVIIIDLHFEFLVTPLTLPWFHITVFFMISELGRWLSERTELASDWLVCSLFMFLSFSLGYNFTTLAALIIIPGTADLMHPELRQFDGLFTVATNLCLFCHRFNHIEILNFFVFS